MNKAIVTTLLLALVAAPVIITKDRVGGYVGVSAFAGMHKDFPVGKFLKQYPPSIKKPAISVVWGTFGSSSKLIDSFVSLFTDRPHLIQVHLTNEPGRRSGKMYAGEFMKRASVDQYIQRLESRDKKVVRNLTRRVRRVREFFYPYQELFGTTVVLSTGLESHLTDKAHRTIVRVVRKVWPEAIIGRNSLTTASYGGADVYEQHNSAGYCRGGRSIICNLDGVSVGVSAIDRYFNKAGLRRAEAYISTAPHNFATFLWYAEQQGLHSTQGWGMVGAPRPRNREFIVTKEAIKFSRRVLK